MQVYSRQSKTDRSLSSSTSSEKGVQPNGDFIASRCSETGMSGRSYTVVGTSERGQEYTVSCAVESTTKWEIFRISLQQTEQAVTTNFGQFLYVYQQK